MFRVAATLTLFPNDGNVRISGDLRLLPAERAKRRPAAADPYGAARAAATHEQTTPGPIAFLGWARSAVTTSRPRPMGGEGSTDSSWQSKNLSGTKRNSDAGAAFLTATEDKDRNNNNNQTIGRRVVGSNRTIEEKTPILWMHWCTESDFRSSPPPTYS